MIWGYMLGFLIIPTTPFWIPWVYKQMYKFKHEFVPYWNRVDSFMSFMCLVAWPIILPLLVVYYIVTYITSLYGRKFNEIGEKYENRNKN